MVTVDSTDGATIAVAGVIHQDVDPELGEVPDLEGYRQREGVRDVKLGDELPEDQRRVLKDLVRRYPDVFTDMPGETDVIQHQIRLTDDTPIRCKPYPLPYAMREELRNEVDTMLEMGVVRPSTSPYASPIVMVKKKDGSNKVCIDFRKLNKITEVDPEPMTTAEDLFRRLSGKKYLSKIDLTKGYWQIPVAPEDVHKTAFVTPDGQYEFTRMLFGMVNSGVTLVRGLRKILDGMPGVGSYIDDIVIHSDSWEDHIKTLKELFGRLRKARITARPTKCLLGASRMEFLGHQVGGDVITPSCDNLGPKYSMPDYQEASEIFLESHRLLQGSHTSLRRDFSTIDRPPKERKSRTYPVERGKGVCILPFEGIPVAGASPEASRFEQAVCVTNRRIRSWCGGCATKGK